MNKKLSEVIEYNLGSAFLDYIKDHSNDSIKKELVKKYIKVSDLLLIIKKIKSQGHCCTPECFPIDNLICENELIQEIIKQKCKKVE